MLTRRILDVIADTLILLALAIAGAGHILPWAQVRVPDEQKTADRQGSSAAGAERHDFHRRGSSSYEPVPVEFQVWHAKRSGIALGVTALLVGASLALDLGVRARKFLVLLMFAGALAAIAFQLMIYSPYPITDAHRSFDTEFLYEREGFFVALIPSIIACALCVIRMSWTMTASAQRKPQETLKVETV